MRALDAFPTALFLDVLENKSWMDDMLKFTDGKRRVPVIVDANDVVTIGYNGGS